MSQSEQPATEGRIVHVEAGVGHCQPAIVVRSWGDGRGTLNLQVFRDGGNDREPANLGAIEASAGTRWATSVGYVALAEGPSVQSWHWPTEHAS